LFSGKGIENLSAVLKSNNKSHRAVETTIYDTIKVNVMALDFAAHNLPFSRNRDSSVSKRKVDNLIFLSIHVQAYSFLLFMCKELLHGFSYVT
jgi:hypothetical protein